MSLVLHSAYALAALSLVAYALRADFEKYSLFTVGVFKRVRRAPATNTEHECSELNCEETVVDGERRRRCKEIVVAGCPVIRYGGGDLHLCEDHVSFEFLNGEVTRTTTERIAQSLAPAFVEFLDWQLAPEPERDEKDPFGDVTETAGAALELAAVGVIVLSAAMMLRFLDPSGGAE